MVQVMEMEKTGKLNLADTQFNNIYTSWYVCIYMQRHTHTYICTQTMASHSLNTLTEHLLIPAHMHRLTTDFQK